MMGTLDRGDIDMSPLPVVVEVKNCRTMKLSEWLKEAEKEKTNASAKVGVVWHKKTGTADPASWYITMSGNDFMTLLESANL